MATVVNITGLAEQAYVLGYPLVLTDRIMAKAPVNQLVHARGEPDTLRSSGWLDLAEPIVLSLPDTRGRYYVLWLRDAWNTVFASLGARTTGTGPHEFALLGPGRHGVEAPSGLTPIAAPTRVVHVSGCLEAVGEREEDALERACDGFALRSLSGERLPSPPAVLSAADLATPVEQVESLDARAFFAEVARLAHDNPPDAAGRLLLDRLFGLGAAPSLHADLEEGVRRGRAAVRAEAERPSGTTIGHWRVDYGFGRRGADRLRLAGTARAGEGADPAADALSAVLDSDADGRPLIGANRYLLRFAPDAPPPVHGFWSLSSRAPAAGAAHSIGDLRGLVADRDGSLPIYLQHAPPARRRRSNWLPVPAGPFSIALHLYWPAEEALERRWSPPAVTRVG